MDGLGPEAAAAGRGRLRGLFGTNERGALSLESRSRSLTFTVAADACHYPSAIREHSGKWCHMGLYGAGLCLFLSHHNFFYPSFVLIYTLLFSPPSLTHICHAEVCVLNSNKLVAQSQEFNPQWLHFFFLN